MDDGKKSENKTFNIEITTNKNISYLINFTLCNSIEIKANQTNTLFWRGFFNQFTFQQIRENKYFLQFDSLNEIFDELNEIVKKNQISIEVNENTLLLKIPLPSHKNKEIIFELKEKRKIEEEKISDKSESMMKEITFLKNENAILKNEVKDLKEKLDILWKDKEEREQIVNLNSNIININKEYNKRLKFWIDPLKKVKAELLYRLSENGDKYSTFHELCDNKGPTLTLFLVKDGNIVGIYTPLSWDTTSNWKNDMETFIFNLNKNQKYKKLKADYSAYCGSLYGPWTAEFGCHSTNSMKSIKRWNNLINEYYDKGSEILPSINKEKAYNLLETEVYRIIIE